MFGTKSDFSEKNGTMIFFDVPKTFDELLNSERCYLNKKLEKKLGTDLVYFLNAFGNIIFKGARSQ